MPAMPSVLSTLIAVTLTPQTTKPCQRALRTLPTLARRDATIPPTNSEMTADTPIQMATLVAELCRAYMIFERLAASA